MRATIPFISAGIALILLLILLLLFALISNPAPSARDLSIFELTANGQS